MLCHDDHAFLRVRKIYGTLERGRKKPPFLRPTKLWAKAEVHSGDVFSSVACGALL